MFCDIKQVKITFAGSDVTYLTDTAGLKKTFSSGLTLVDGAGKNILSY